jgi:hypothetical protein
VAYVNHREEWRDEDSIVAAAKHSGSARRLGGAAISAQDKYAVQVPGGLSLSECRGYEEWPAVAVSHPEDKINMIVANQVMIEAYLAGVPGNGKPFPDGAKTVKIHWKPKQSTEAPFPVAVPDTLIGLGCMVKDSKRFADGGVGDTPSLIMTRRPTPSRPTHLYRATMPSAGSRAIR